MSKEQARMTVTEAIAGFAAGLSWQELPAPLRAQVKAHLIDTLGVMCAGVSTAHGQALVRTLGPGQLGDGATIVGVATGFSPRDAALANAFHGRIHTYDDTLESGPLHSGSSVIAAALASAELAGASGPVLLRAILAGYEAAARLSHGFGRSHYARGFQNTGTCNAFGAAVAAGCARGLTAQALVDALGMAGGMASGVRQYQVDGSMSDSALNGAHAAMAGVMAAELAAAGLNGPRAIFEGRFGLGRLMSDGPDCDGMLAGLGQDYLFAATALKPYPSCRFTHGPIHEIIRLRDAHQVAPAGVVQIEIATFRQSIEVSDRPAFKTRTEALLSHQYAAAAALARGRFTWAELAERSFTDPALCALARRVRVVHDPALEQRSVRAWPHRVRLSLDDGRVLEATSDNPPGGLEQPLERPALLAKFLANTEPVLSERAAMSLIATIDDLESLSDVRSAGELLRPQRAHAVTARAAE